MESEEERGVAHMIEHLAFRASRTSPQEFGVVKEVRTLFRVHQGWGFPCTSGRTARAYRISCRGRGDEAFEPAHP